MADSEQLEILFQKGPERWNEWRDKNPDIRPDLSAADLSLKRFSESAEAKAWITESPRKEAHLRNINLKEADLRGVSFTGQDLTEADLSGSDLREAELCRANCSRADFRGADLLAADFTSAEMFRTNLTGCRLADATFDFAVVIQSAMADTDLTNAGLFEANFSSSDLSEAVLENADLSMTILSGTDLTNANLQGSNLRGACLVGTKLREADLSGSKVYGISAWDLELKDAIQSDLVITRGDEPVITVDNLEIAQFIYLLLHNEKIRNIIDSIVSKVVLILGRFTPERKAVLDMIRDELRKFDYVSVVFDFEKPAARDFIETVSTLAHLAHFVVADITDAKLVLEEIPQIVRNVATPVKPLLLAGTGQEPLTLSNLRRNQRSLLETFVYADLDSLVKAIPSEIIAPSVKKARELQKAAFET